MRRIEQIKVAGAGVGNRTRVKVVKNKVAPPFTVAEFDILYGQGISKSSEILDMGVTLGILEKSGAWFYYDGNRIGQGKENARQFLESDPALMAEIEAKIKEKGAAVEAERAEEAEDDEDDEELDIRLLDMDDTDEDDDGASGDDEE